MTGAGEGVKGGVVALSELVSYCDELLDAHSGSDYGPNGLQVEGNRPIRHLATAVSANLALLDHVVESGADALLVHHGIVWNHHDGRVIGPYGRRVERLLSEGISLLAYHLPLDRHPEVGNAAALAERMGFEVDGGFGDHKGLPLGVRVQVPDLTPDALVASVSAVTGEPITAYLAGPSRVRSVGIVTGAAQGYVQQAIDAGLDAYLTGEVTEWTRAMVEEAGIHFIAAGHYRTECYGVQAVGERVSKRFGIKVTFIDQPNPV